MLSVNLPQQGVLLPSVSAGPLLLYLAGGFGLKDNQRRISQDMPLSCGMLTSRPPFRISRDFSTRSELGALIVRCTKERLPPRRKEWSCSQASSEPWRPA